MSFAWYHPSISRLRAEELLLSSGKDGSFVIRDSESVSNAHVLCLLHEGRIHHYRILWDESNKNFYMQTVPGVAPQGFSNLEQLVTFHSQGHQGLPCELKQPAVLQQDKDVTDDDTDDEDDDLDEPDGRPIENEYECPKQFLTNVEQTLRGSESERLEKEFHSALSLYLGNGIKKDMEIVANGEIVLEEMQKLLATSSVKLIQELKSFLSRVNMLQEVFSIGDDHKLTCLLPEHSTEEQPNFKLLMDLLAGSIAGAKSLQTQAVSALKEVQRINQEEDKEPAGNRTRVFDVMVQGMATSSFKNKLHIVVNYEEGKISFLKNLNETPDTNNTCDQSKVTQLVKSKDNIKRLRMKMEPKQSRDFEFDDGKSREVFCQLIQQMKHQDSKNKTRNQVSIFIGTWNMGNANPPADIKSWLKCRGDGKTMDADLAHFFSYDIYAFGTQECPVGEKEWIFRIKKELKKLFPEKEFISVAVCSLWSIRLVVFVNQDLKNMISHVQQSSVKTGIANALGNKGGVGISFSLGPVSLCFVNCHLAARSTEARMLRRNQNFLDILKGLNLGQKGVFGLTHQFHHVFWFGDLNYRIDLDVQEVLNAVKCSNFVKLKQHDQLREQKEKGNVFLGFEEEGITFAPTYRYKRGSTDYVWEKAKRSGVLTNVPSWCDRVLKHSFPQSKISCTSYGCSTNIKTSDHWPVFCTYVMSLPFTVSPDDSIPKSPISGECEIRFQTIRGKIKTNSKTQFYIEFHSTCLEDMVKTEKNSIVESGKKHFSDNKSSRDYSYPEWSKTVIPPLHPMISDYRFLEEQHLLLVIKSVDNDESYDNNHPEKYWDNFHRRKTFVGECCIALRTMVNVLPQECHGIILSHHGEKTGEMMIEMHVKLPDNNNVTRSSQSLDLISTDDLEMTRKASVKMPQVPQRRSHVPQGIISTDDLEMTRKASVKMPQVPQRRSHVPQASPVLPEKTAKRADENPPVILKRHSTTQPETMSRDLPPLPAKKSKPKTVGEIMERIGFPQYTNCLLKYGWDDLEFLSDLKEEDLTEAGVPKPHQRMILAAIKKFIH